jgi:hypothetical protein
MRISCKTHYIQKSEVNTITQIHLRLDIDKMQNTMNKISVTELGKGN